MQTRIAIIGGGGWGLSIANLLHENGHRVLVWEHDPHFLTQLIDTRSNPTLLPGIMFSPEITFTGDWKDVSGFEASVVVLATPAQFLRSTLSSLNQALGNDALSFWESSNLQAIVNVAKGIEEHTLSTMSQIIKDLLPPSAHSIICCLSGPSHAEEVAKHVPTAVVIAGGEENILLNLQQLFSNPYFRVYRSDDLIGVEIGGAVKNIIAIAAGIIDGLGFGDNTKGALITRGIVEIQRLGLALGAKPETFLGLSGIGDLVTTAISPHSRNRSVGFGIGQGRSLKQIIAEMKMIAEGVASTRSVYYLAQKIGIEMPITDQIFQVLYEDKEPILAITELMTRDLKAEANS